MDGADAVKIIELYAQDARKALLKSESYFDFDLPHYFDFSPTLGAISEKLSGKALADIWTLKPGAQEGLNHVILHSKDGKYAWRPQEIMHPVIYVALIDTLTSEANWALIKARFAEHSYDPRIECTSAPVVSTSKQKDKAAQVYSWWMAMEQRSLELSLKYTHLLQTDVTDCYGSIYTHSIAWALHGKDHAKENKYDKGLLGNRIDALIRSSRNNQTNGIPQGSNAMNLIAELILGYADMQLSAAIDDEGIADFKILRYRDDYRIFSNNPADAETITRLLAEVLRDFGMKLSPDKTSVSDSIIQSSIKEDKLFWIGKEKKKKSLLKHMLLLHELAKTYPNSGSVSVALSKFQKRLEKLEKVKDPVVPIIGILTDIALHNPRTYPLFAAIMSKLLTFVPSEDRKPLIEDIMLKFERVPNSGHLAIWVQRFAVPMGISVDLDEPVCKALENPEFLLWNSAWLPEAYLELLYAKTFIDKEKIDELKMVIEAGEVQLFIY